MSLVLQVILKIRTDRVDEFMRRLNENATAARSEPGCRQFDVLVDPEDRSRVMLYEVYADEAAFEAHQQTAHFKKYLAEAVPLLEARERKFWRHA